MYHSALKSDRSPGSDAWSGGYKNLILESIVIQLDVDTQRSNFFQQYIERFRHPWIHTMVTINNIFVYFGSSSNVIRFNR
jgi:hypothetical protein